MKRLLKLLPLLMLFAYGTAKALGWFLIPFVMGITTITGMGVGAFCEIAKCFESPAEVVGQSISKLQVTIKDNKGVESKIEIPTAAPEKSPPTIAPVDKGWYQIPAMYLDGDYTRNGESYYVEVVLDEHTDPRTQGNPYSSLVEARRAIVNTMRTHHIYGREDFYVDAPNQGFSCKEDSDYVYCRHTKLSARGIHYCPANLSHEGVDGCWFWIEKVTGEKKDGVKRLLKTAKGWVRDIDDPDWDFNERWSPNDAEQNVIIKSDGSAFAISSIGDKNKITVINKDADNPDASNTRSLDLGSNQVVDNYYTEHGSGDVSSVTNNYINNIINNGGGGGVVSFPSDYAKTSDINGISEGIKSDIGGLKGSIDSIGDELKPTVSQGDPTPGGWSDPWGNTFKTLTGWSLPAHDNYCPSPSFEVFDSHFVIDSHCTLWADSKETITLVMSAFWLVTGLFIVLRA